MLLLLLSNRDNRGHRRAVTDLRTYVEGSMKLLQLLQGKSVLATERRRAPRTFADKQVIIAWKGSKDRVGCATAVDWSVLGLRIRHNLPLKRGDEVTVITPDQTIYASVIWTGDIENIKEAGLLLSRAIEGITAF
jgi:hypothetical protein